MPPAVHVLAMCARGGHGFPVAGTLVTSRSLDKLDQRVESVAEERKYPWMHCGEWSTMDA
jgi:hypothetical protein